ncbi:hypothetical protein [Streptomyces sp. SP18CS02]|uniref:hypothetical protein n=1 Tax=Streptomyces sp. SP18CS02 TaxID=3002531 RepID=UPI002E79C5BF|nr:hypothetical protein [Streptomyces sp. SP18CS02]MEE1753008.1 hypothetical protein [Streptomyces sp. SP18CS02]
MNWWLRAHWAAWCAGTVVLMLVLAPLLVGSSLPIPSLFAGMAGALPVPLMLPAIPAAMALYAAQRVPHGYELTSVRPQSRYRTVWIVGICFLAAAAAVLEMVVIDFPLALAVVRNLAGYIGTGMIVQYLAGRQYGPIAVAVLPPTCALIGLGSGGRPFSWTWPLHPTDSPWAAAAALGLLALGLTVGPRRPPWRSGGHT